MRRRTALLLALLWLPAGAAASEPPQRIVSLGGAVTETLFALGVGDRVVAVDESSVHPPVARRRPKVGYVRQTSAEGIASMRPDLVIAPETLGPAAVPKQLAAAGIRLERVAEARSVAGAIRRIHRIGALVGREKEAAALAASIERRVAAAAARREGSGKTPRVLFLFVHGTGAPVVAGAGTAAQAMIEAAGGRNAITGFEGYRPLTPEAAVAARPDVILTTPRALRAVGGRAGLWRTPGLAPTPAGRARRVVVMDDLELLGFGPRTGEAIEKLTGALHR